MTVIGTATHWGDVPIEQVQPGYAALKGLVATYVNFGKVNTYGADFGATYYFTPALSGTLNYSYFEYSADEEDPANDFDKNGTVDFRDLLVNAPTHKAGAGLNYSGEKFFGNVFGRWVQAYDYFSSFQIASRTKTNPDGSPILYRGVPIVENARGADAFNYGPLGGYFDLSLGFGYRFSRMLTAGFQVSNALNQELREFTAAPPTRRLYSVEVRVDLPAIGR